MRITALVPCDRRVIEIGARSAKIAESLGSAGYGQYLAVVRDEARRALLEEHSDFLRTRTAVSRSKQIVRQNNAELLVLNGAAALSVGRFRSVRHAQFVAIPISNVPWHWFAALLAVFQCVLGRLSWPQIGKCGSGAGSPGLLVFEVRRTTVASARRYVPHSLGVNGLIAKLQARGARYAVLRWFKELPHVRFGEDLDVLVDDGDLETIRAIASEGPGIQPLDVYSVTGLPGADFRSMPYYPPYLAAELLDRVVVHRSGCCVPASREHFLSLAYHALYHKGYDSGLPRRGRSAGRIARRADHDYPAMLAQLARQQGIDVGITLEDLDAYLDNQGWRPPHDMLVRLARRNAFVRSLLPRGKREHSAAEDRLAVFLVREQAVGRGGIDRAVELVKQYGFYVLAVREFEERQRPMIARCMRGGNWGQGPWPISGGTPVAAIVAYDPAPMTVSSKQRRRFPFLANARLLCKDKIRDTFNEGLPASQHCNVIHSSDNGREAMDYLRICAPDLVTALSAGEISYTEPRERKAA